MTPIELIEQLSEFADSDLDVVVSFDCDNPLPGGGHRFTIGGVILDEDCHTAVIIP